jgi:hypothetical protein
MWRLLWPRKYHGQNKRHGFLKEYMEKEESLQKNPATVLLGAPRAHPPVAENLGEM